MNLIFMNSLEQRVDENRVRTAQVTICEQQGAWQVLWNEPREDGKITQDSWFAGNEWVMMLKTFKDRLREKVKEGFIPLLEGYGEMERSFSMKGRMTQMFHFYSEQHRKEEVYSLLREWRKEQAVKEGKAAFIIASNRILDMISAFLPHTIEELKQIQGLGENRAKTYGDAMLTITNAFTRETVFPLHWVTESIDKHSFELWLIEQAKLREQLEQDKLQEKRELLEAITRGEDLAMLQKRFSLRRTEIMLKIEELAKEGNDIGILIDSELHSVPTEELTQVNELFLSMGDRYLKPVMQKLYSAEDLKGKDVNRIYEWMRLYRLKFRKQAV